MENHNSKNNFREIISTFPAIAAIINIFNNTQKLLI